MPIKTHLSKIMGEQKFNATQLARRAGLSRYAIYELYHERTQGIAFETLAKLCKALNCSVGELLEYIPDGEKNTPSTSSK